VRPENFPNLSKIQTMLRNYFKTAFRNMRRNKLFTGLNIFGLATGLACSILIFLWVQDELSYDRFNPGAERIFRLIETVKDVQTPMVPTAFISAIKGQVPQAKNATRLYPAHRVMTVNGRTFNETNAFFTDSNFLQIFNYPLLRGDRRTVLVSPNSVLLTEATAISYFGSVDRAMNSPIFDQTDSVLRQVTGILADVPANSHLQFDLLMPVSNWDRMMDQSQTWRYFDSYTYVQLADRATLVQAIETRLNAIRDSAIVNTPAVPARLSLQPLLDVHLRSHVKDDIPRQGNIEYVRIFSIIAVFILLIACVNFMNLATALSGTRAKEVGLRKTVGALRWQLIGQFMAESLLLALLSLGLALLLVYAVLPSFNALSGKSMSLDLFDLPVLGKMFGMALITGVLAGCYPAFYLSSFNVIDVIKGRLRLGGKGSFLRNGLVVVQFSIAVILMISSLIIYQQLRFMHDRDPGFDRKRLLYIRIPETTEGLDFSALLNELRRLPFVDDLTMTWELPTGFHYSSPLSWRGMDKKTLVIAKRMGVDEHYIHTMGMKMAAGRFYTATDADTDSAYVINETAARAMGVTPSDAVGKLITINNREGTVVGVTKDFNFQPVYQPIEPLVMKRRGAGEYLLIRVNGGAVQKMLATIQDRCRRVLGGTPFSYGFVDQDLDRLYQSEAKMGLLFRIFSVLAIGISCLGLFGLATFATRRRTREIGVRKVLGAGEFSVVLLLTREFLVLVALALLIAFPIAWYAMHRWLEGYVYKVAISGWIFAGAGALALAVAFVTVSYQTVRAAMANPVDALRGSD
jgi:putative ABC transport system permease protein